MIYRAVLCHHCQLKMYKNQRFRWIYTDSWKCSYTCKRLLLVYIYIFVLYVIRNFEFRNSISTIMKHEYRDYVDRIWNWSENVHRNYKIFNMSMYSMYFVEITKIFQQSTVHYINKPRLFCRNIFNIYYVYSNYLHCISIFH